MEASKEDSPDAAHALQKLCQCYWYPLYVFVRRKGYSPSDAQDLTQEFFARFLEKRYVSLADQGRGKFRTFLLKSLEHFLINEWTKANAIKRGGGQRIISWDEKTAEERYAYEPIDEAAPDKIFEKRWASELLSQVLHALRQEFMESGKPELFEALKVSLWGEGSSVSYDQIGTQLGMSETAVKVAAHRLRQRYRELLRAEVAQTVSTTAEVDEELKYLAAVLRG